MTRAEKLLLALSDIRPDWVLDAAPKNTLPETGPRPRRSKVKYWGAAGALAACLLLACSAVPRWRTHTASMARRSPR